MRHIVEAEAGESTKRVCAMGFVSRHGRYSTLIGLTSRKVFTEAIFERLQPGTSGRGVRRKRNREVQERNGNQGAVRPSNILFAPFTYLEASVNLLQSTEPVPHFFSIDEGVGFVSPHQGKAEQARVSSGEVSILSEASSYPASRMLHCIDCFDDSVQDQLNSRDEVSSSKRNSVSNTLI